MKPSSTGRDRGWRGALLAVALVVVGAVLALGVVRAVPDLSVFTSTSEARDTRVMHAVSREEQLVLLSLGIQGISEKSQRSRFLGVNVPGSERASFLQYSFNAKLGIEGKNVSIERVGDNAFKVSIPEFIFIGHDNPTFKLVAEDNGTLSFLTPRTDAVEMINSILNDELQQEYLGTNDEILRDQAKHFYSGLVSRVDPAIRVTFEFTPAA